jgi:hypothetical protein
VPEFSPPIRRNAAGKNGSDLLRSRTSALPVTHDIFFKLGRPAKAAPLAGRADVLTPRGATALDQVRTLAQQEAPMHAQLVGSSSSDGRPAANLAASERRVHWVENSLADKSVVLADPPGTRSDCEPLGSGRYACGSAHANAKPDPDDRRVRVVAFPPLWTSLKPYATTHDSAPDELERLLKAPLENASAVLLVPAALGEKTKKKVGFEGSAEAVVDQTPDAAINVILEWPYEVVPGVKVTPGVQVGTTTAFPAVGAEAKVEGSYDLPVSDVQVTALLGGKAVVNFPWDSTAHRYGKPTIAPHATVGIEFTVDLTKNLSLTLAHELDAKFDFSTPKPDATTGYTGSLKITFHGDLSGLFRKKR